MYNLSVAVRPFTLKLLTLINLAAGRPFTCIRPCSQCLKKSRAADCVYAPKPVARRRPPKGSMAARLKRLEGMVRSMLEEGQGGRRGKTMMITAPLPSKEDGEGNTVESSSNREEKEGGNRSIRAPGPSVGQGVWPAGAGKVVRANTNGVRRRGGSTTTTYVGAMHLWLYWMMYVVSPPLPPSPPQNHFPVFSPPFLFLFFLLYPMIYLDLVWLSCSFSKKKVALDEQDYSSARSSKSTGRRANLSCF